MERQWLAGDKATAIKWICMKSRVSRALTLGKVFLRHHYEYLPEGISYFQCRVLRTWFRFPSLFFDAPPAMGEATRVFIQKSAKKGIGYKKRDGQGLGSWGEETLMDVSDNYVMRFSSRSKSPPENLLEIWFIRCALIGGMLKKETWKPLALDKNTPVV